MDVISRTTTAITHTQSIGRKHYKRKMKRPDEFYESQEATPMDRVLGYLNNSRFKTLKGFCNALIKFEVRKIFRNAQTGGNQIVISTRRYNHNDLKYFSSSINHAIKQLEKAGCTLMKKEEKDLHTSWLFMFPTDKKEAIDELLKKENFVPTYDEVNDVYNTCRGHKQLPETTHRYEIYRDFVTAPFELGGLGISWEWVKNGGPIEHAPIKGQGSLVRKIQMETEEAIKQKEEELAKILGKQTWEHRKKLQELSEMLSDQLNLLQRAAQIHGLEDTPEIKKLKRELEKMKKELVN